MSEVLIDRSYLVMNNHLRYKGKTVFFTGNVVETNKNDLLDYICKAVKKDNRINPLCIVPVTDNNNPDYTIITQKDPVFTVMTKI